MCVSGDTLQEKVEEILGDIEVSKTHIDDILVLIKDLFKNYIDQLRIIFCRLSAAGLKVNNLKCSFGLKNIPYLSYAITREDINTEPKELQGIMDLGQTDTTIKAQALICMAHYYREMCQKWSHVLDSLTEAARFPKGRNILWNDSIEIYFKELKYMVSADTILSYPDWELTLKVQTDYYDKQ